MVYILNSDIIKYNKNNIKLICSQCTFSVRFPNVFRGQRKKECIGNEWVNQHRTKKGSFPLKISSVNTKQPPEECWKTVVVKSFVKFTGNTGKHLCHYSLALYFNKAAGCFPSYRNQSIHLRSSHKALTLMKKRL